MSDQKPSEETGGEEVMYPIVAKLLAERHQSGQSETLEQWLVAARTKLAEFRQTQTSRKLKSDAEKIEKAYEVAAELIEQLMAASSSKSSENSG